MEDKTSKQKKGVRRAAKAGGSPIPCGPTGGAMDDMPSACGHMACTGGVCNVRYVGPVSHMRDHHVVHAARHASHVWSAAIVTGLAVVLTGSLGYAAFGAEYANPSGSMYGEFQQINNRLDKIEGMVAKLLDRCQLSSSCDGQQAEKPSQDECINGCKKEFGDNIEKANACIRQRCEKQASEQPAQTQEQCKSSCEAKYAAMDLTAEQLATNVKACMERNCPAQPTGDTCTQQCKEKYKDDATAISKCLVENKCPGAPSTSGASVEQCYAKCYDTRVACFKEAGSNYVALRTCVANESSCKSACKK